MEHSEIESVAEQYRRDGYEVRVRPSRAARPAFLRKYEIDMLAKKGTEHVVVEVKHRSELESEKELTYLAAEVNARPGWRFDLVVTGTNEPTEVIPEGASEPDSAQVCRLADTAERLLSEGDMEAACLTAWAATEAALRHAARKSEIALESTKPEFVLKTLVAEGLVSREEYERLQQGMQIRNAVANGLKTPALDRAVVRDTIDAARRYLALQMFQSATS